jgi:hypothetical protein
MKIVVKRISLFCLFSSDYEIAINCCRNEINSVELRIALQLDHFVDLVAVSRPARMVCLCLNSSTEHGKDRPSDADEESPESLQ